METECHRLFGFKDSEEARVFLFAPHDAEFRAYNAKVAEIDKALYESGKYGSRGMLGLVPEHEQEVQRTMQAFLDEDPVRWAGLLSAIDTYRRIFDWEMEYEEREMVREDSV